MKTHLFLEAKHNAYLPQAGALELFVDSPRRPGVEDLYSQDSGVEVHAGWRVRAQIILADGDSTWVFPAPKPRDPTPFGPAFAEPDFNKVEQLFWADETTHKARSGE